MSSFFVTSREIQKKRSYYLMRGSLVGNLSLYRPAAKSARRSPRFSFARVVSFLANLSVVLSLVGLLVLFGPKLVFAVYTPTTQILKSQFEKTALGGNLATGPTTSTYIPPFNENLPEGLWLEIPVIGVRTQPLMTADENEALDTGVWVDPSFNLPGEGRTTVLAAHRYGWKWWWRDQYWRYHSFNLLPETQPGDLVDITFGQRKYIYEIYLATEGLEVTDHGADLILYTCKYLDSPLRYFRYARLINPEADSQK